MNFTLIDLIVIFIYLFIITLVGLYFSNTKNFLIVIPLLDTQNLDNALNLDTVRNLNIAIHQHINTKILLMNDLQFDNTRFHKVR